MANLDDLKTLLESFGTELHTDIERAVVVMQKASDMILAGGDPVKIQAMMDAITVAKAEAQEKFVNAIAALEAVVTPA